MEWCGGRDGVDRCSRVCGVARAAAAAAEDLSLARKVFLCSLSSFLAHSITASALGEVSGTISLRAAASSGKAALAGSGSFASSISAVAAPSPFLRRRGSRRPQPKATHARIAKPPTMYSATPRTSVLPAQQTQKKHQDEKAVAPRPPSFPRSPSASPGLALPDVASASLERLGPVQGGVSARTETLDGWGEGAGLGSALGSRVSYVVVSKVGVALKPSSTWACLIIATGCACVGTPGVAKASRYFERCDRAAPASFCGGQGDTQLEYSILLQGKGRALCAKIVAKIVATIGHSRLPVGRKVLDVDVKEAYDCVAIVKKRHA
eukprot:scaffold464_cov244-Pinguiococcus_pyrenoidosus.AAC.9